MFRAKFACLALHRCQCCGHEHIAFWLDENIKSVIEDSTISDCPMCGRAAEPVSCDLGELLMRCIGKEPVV